MTPARRLASIPASTAARTREALLALDEAEKAVREKRALLEELRRKIRDETPGMFVLPSLSQLRRESGMN